MSYLSENYDNVITSINNKKINTLDEVNAGFAFRLNEKGFQTAILEFLEWYYQQFEVKGDSIVIKNELSLPDIQQIHNLLFVNFFNEIFLARVQKAVSVCKARIALPLSTSIHEKFIYNTEGLKAVTSLIKTKIFDYNTLEKEEEKLAVNNNMYNYEMRKLVVDSIIKQHTIFRDYSDHYTKNLESIAKRANIKFKDYKPPKKSFDRTMNKLNDYCKKLGKNFPWYYVRDITRKSYEFEDFEEMVNFYECIQKITDANCSIVEVENQFENIPNDKKYDFKSVYIVLKINVKNFTLLMEIQLMHKELLKVKKAYSKFDTILKASFKNIAFEYYQNIIQIGLSSVGDDFKVDYENNFFTYLINYCGEVAKTALNKLGTDKNYTEYKSYKLFEEGTVTYCYTEIGSRYYYGYFDKSTEKPCIYISGSKSTNNKDYDETDFKAAEEKNPRGCCGLFADSIAVKIVKATKEYNYAYYLNEMEYIQFEINGYKFTIMGVVNTFNYDADGGIVLKYSIIINDKYYHMKIVTVAKDGTVKENSFYQFLNSSNKIDTLSPDNKQTTWLSKYISNVDWTVYYTNE